MDQSSILRLIMTIMYFISAILNGVCAVMYAKDNVGITIGYSVASMSFLTWAILNLIIVLSL